MYCYYSFNLLFSKNQFLVSSINFAFLFWNLFMYLFILIISFPCLSYVLSFPPLVRVEKLYICLLSFKIVPNIWRFSSVQFSRSVVSDSLWPHELQHSRPPCPSPTPGVHSDSRPSSQWCHPAISSSVVPFSSCPQSLPASGKWVSSSHQVAKVLEFQL